MRWTVKPGDPCHDCGASMVPGGRRGPTSVPHGQVMHRARGLCVSCYTRRCKSGLLDSPEPLPPVQVRPTRSYDWPNLSGVDPVAVERALNGRRQSRAPRDVRLAVIRAWLAQGKPLNQLERQTGWNPHRDLRSIAQPEREAS